MIQKGDKFTNTELKQSVHEVCNYDIIKHINTKNPSYGILFLGGNIIITQLTFTPKPMRIYAFKNTKIFRPAP